MKVAIADDNRQILTSVEELLRAYMQQRDIPLELAVFDTAQGFIDSLEEEIYDLVVMDIYFDDQPLTGVDAIKALRKNDRRTNVVFLTDSSDHMADAFQVHAFSYVIKGELGTMFPQVLDDLMAVVTIPRSITLSSGKQTIVLAVSDILSVEADGHYLLINDIHGEVKRIRMTFSEISKKLESSKEFLLINKGVLVNMDYIRKFENKMAIMTNGTRFPARVRGYTAIVRQWHDYNFDKLRGGGM